MDIEIIGHVGVERHYLLPPHHLPIMNGVSKGVAQNILAHQDMLGGSVTFACLAATHFGIIPRVSTSVGQDLIGEAIVQKFQQLFKINLPRSKPKTDQFLSLWHKGKGQRELFIETYPSPYFKLLESDAKILLFLGGITLKDLIITTQKYQDRFIGVVISLDIIKTENMLNEVFNNVDIVFMNLEEAKTITQKSCESDLIEDLISRLISSRAFIVLTGGFRGAKVLNCHTHSPWVVPNASVQFPLGGGDLLATLVCLLWWRDSNVNVNVINRAVELTTSILQEIEPFAGNSSLLVDI